MLSVRHRFTVLLALFIITIPSYAESFSGSSENISFLTLAGFFLSINRPSNYEELYSKALPNRELALTAPPFSCFLICFPAGSDPNSPVQTFSAKSDSTDQNTSGSISTSFTLPATCFLTSLGQGEDDPEEPNEDDDEESPVSDVCPICLESLNSKNMELTYCCGRLFHVDCLDQNSRNSPEPLKCPWCRSSPFYYISKPSKATPAPGRRPFPCKHCRSTFRYPNRLSNHLRLHHNYCWCCPVEIGNNFNIQEHNLEHGFFYMCALCNFPTAHANDLYTHITHSHAFRSPRHDCFCFGQIISYKEMRRSGIRHYQCSVCNALNHSYDEFIQHMQTHQPYLCISCNSRFATASDLRNHFSHCLISESDN